MCRYTYQGVYIYWGETRLCVAILTKVCTFIGELINTATLSLTMIATADRLFPTSKP